MDRIASVVRSPAPVRATVRAQRCGHRSSRCRLTWAVHKIVYGSAEAGAAVGHPGHAPGLQIAARQLLAERVSERACERAKEH